MINEQHEHTASQATMGATVRDVMSTRRLVSIAPDDDVALALRLMRWAGVRHLPVVKGHTLVGVFTERDYLRYRAETGGLGALDPVSRFMSAPAEVVSPDDPATVASALMLSRRIGCVPVVADGELVGVVTPNDLLAADVRAAAPRLAAEAPLQMAPDATRLMTVFEAIARRRAVRAYKPDAIDEETVRELLKEAVRAPTAMHAEPWAFAVVQDRALLEKLSDLAKTTWSPDRDGARTVAHPPSALESRAAAILTQPDFNIFYDAGTLIVICARPLGNFVVADCWLAAENLMLAACGMGLGTCCIGFAVPVLNRPEVKAELGIPPDVTAVAPIIVGVPGADTPPTSRKAPDIVCWRT